MPIRHEYDTKKQVLYITLEGEVLLPDVDQLYRDVVTSADFPPDIRSIWDFRKADFTSIDTDFIRSVFIIRSQYPERGSARAAFVAESDLAYGVSRMYETLSSFEMPQHIRVFREFSKAEEWVLAEK